MSAYISSLVHFVQILIILASFNLHHGNAQSANLTTLKLVQVITRHGDRAPIFPYPNDLYKNASVYSINGWGELSEVGAKQSYDLGAYLRQRYDGFLPRKYRKRDFRMLSSDIDRVIMSAEANLAGLYALGPIPRSQDIFREWQPVPIHTIPEDKDNMLEAYASCPKYFSLYNQFLESDEHNNFIEENLPFINFVNTMSGLPTNPVDFHRIFQVQDALRCQHLHNLTLPSWANSTVYEKLQLFKGLSFIWNVQTEEMKRLKVGPLLRRLVEEMKAKVDASYLILGDDDGEFDDIQPYEDPISYRKMYIYAGHDSTITAFLETLKLFQPHVPPYASALILELHKEPGTNDFYVEIFYKNDTNREPYKMDLSTFCGDATDPCYFEEFTSFLQKYIPDDWEMECGSRTRLSYWSVPSLFSGSPNPSHVKSQEKTLLHPLGLTAPGLPGFVLAVIAGISLLTSGTLLMYFLTYGSRSPNQFGLNLYRNLV